VYKRQPRKAHSSEWAFSFSEVELLESFLFR